MALYIAADGGGSKTDFILFDENRTILNTLRAPGTNPRNVGKERSIEIIKDSIACLVSSFPGNDIEKAVLFVPVLWNYNNYVQQFFSFNTEVISDTKASLWAALGSSDGVIISSGTGSFSIGKKDGKEVLVGGWGPVISDAGSGYSIGREVLAHVTQLFDTGEKDELSDLICQLFDLKNIGELKKKQIDPDFLSVSRVASICKNLKDISGNEYLKNVFSHAASDLSTLVFQCVQRLRIPVDDTFSVKLCGGILSELPGVQSSLILILQKKYPNACISVFKGRIIDGTIEYLFRQAKNSNPVSENIC